MTSATEILEQISSLRQRGEAAGYAALASELGALNARLSTVLPALELDRAVELMRAFYPLVFSGMVELSETDPPLRAKLEKTVDITFTLRVEEVDFSLCLKIERGKFSYAFEAPEKYHVKMMTSPSVLLELMTGQADAIEAFMAGDVDAEGELVRARALRAIFEALGDRFGFHIMQF